MPMDRKRYPKNWEAISQQIRFERAKGKCEQCGVQNGWFRRSDDGRAFETLEDAALAAVNIHEDDAKIVRIVLTVAHLGVDKPDGSPGSKDDKMDCRPENLAALCQRCHLNFDRPENLRTQRRNRQQRRESAGALFEYSIQ